MTAMADSFRAWAPLLRVAACNVTLCVAAVGCAGPKDTGGNDSGGADTEPLPTPKEPEGDEACTALTLEHDGPSAPVVGDQWSVFLRCDDATLVGSSVLTVDPPEAAQLDENQVTFRRPGPCTLRLQVGSRAATLDVVVGP